MNLDTVYGSLLPGPPETIYSSFFQTQLHPWVTARVHKAWRYRAVFFSNDSLYLILLLTSLLRQSSVLQSHPSLPDTKSRNARHETGYWGACNSSQ
jgi:hypothetical protein